MVKSYAWRSRPVQAPCARKRSQRLSIPLYRSRMVAPTCLASRVYCACCALSAGAFFVKSIHTVSFF